MTIYRRNKWLERLLGLIVVSMVAVGGAGCMRWTNRYLVAMPLPMATPAPLGRSVDAYFKKQEEAGESQDFVVYEHEFMDDGIRLTPDGEDHLRQIAARVASTPFPVIVERSQLGFKPGAKHEFPVQNDPDLDVKRQQVVVRALTAMGVPNAYARVVIGPAMAPGYTSFEGERAYGRGVSGDASGSRGGGSQGGAGQGGGMFGR